MASQLAYKIFTSGGEYVAACKYLEECAALVSFLGDGASVRYGHSKGWTLWNEGQEIINASESFDRAAKIMADREAQLTRRAEEKRLLHLSDKDMDLTRSLER